MTKTELKKARAVWCQGVECNVLRFPRKGYVELETAMPHFTLTQPFEAKFSDCSSSSLESQLVVTTEYLKGKMKYAAIPLLSNSRKRILWYPGGKYFEVLDLSTRNIVHCKTVVQARNAYNDWS